MFEGEVAGGVGVACDPPEPVLPVPPVPPVPDVGCDDVAVWPEPVPLPPETGESVRDPEGEVAVERDVPEPPEEPAAEREAVSGCAVDGAAWDRSGTYCRCGRPVEGDCAAGVCEGRGVPDRGSPARADDSAVYCVVGSSPPPVGVASGAGAAVAGSAECRSIAATVRPPPTRATAVATRARRWVFFKRASRRRRAARPSGAGAATAESSDGPAGSGPSKPGLASSHAAVVLSAAPAGTVPAWPGAV